MKKTKRVKRAGDVMEVHVPVGAWIFGILIMIAVIVLVATHFGEVEEFANLLEQAQPLWLLVAIGLQIGTYICAGNIWNSVIATRGKHLSIAILARLSVEKLTINQLLPTGGVMGNLFVVRAMKRYGVSFPLAVEALLIDTLSHYGAFAVMSAVTLVILELTDHVTSVIAWLIGIIAVILIAVPLVIIWVLKHRTWKPPHWIARIRNVRDALDAVARVSPSHVLSLPILSKTFVFQLAIYAFDSATLWTMLQAIDITVSPVTAFCALIIGVMAGTISFLPGGIGSFEAGCVTALTLLGVPIEAALTGTLLLRLLTLWLPLIPGMVLARQDMTKQHTNAPKSS